MMDGVFSPVSSLSLLQRLHGDSLRLSVVRECSHPGNRQVLRISNPPAIEESVVKHLLACGCKGPSTNFV